MPPSVLVDIVDGGLGPGRCRGLIGGSALPVHVADCDWSKALIGCTGRAAGEGEVVDHRIGVGTARLAGRSRWLARWSRWLCRLGGRCAGRRLVVASTSGEPQCGRREKGNEQVSPAGAARHAWSSHTFASSSFAFQDHCCQLGRPNGELASSRHAFGFGEMPARPGRGRPRIAAVYPDLHAVRTSARRAVAAPYAVARAMSRTPLRPRGRTVIEACEEALLGRETLRTARRSEGRRAARQRSRTARTDGRGTSRCRGSSAADAAPSSQRRSRLYARKALSPPRRAAARSASRASARHRSPRTARNSHWTSIPRCRSSEKVCRAGRSCSSGNIFSHSWLMCSR